MNDADRQIHARMAWQDAQRLARRRTQQTAEAITLADDRRAALVATLDILRTLDDHAESAATVAGILAIITDLQRGVEQTERDAQQLAREALQARTAAAHLLGLYLESVRTPYRPVHRSIRKEVAHVR